MAPDYFVNSHGEPLGNQAMSDIRLAARSIGSTALSLSETPMSIVLRAGGTIG